MRNADAAHEERRDPTGPATDDAELVRRAQLGSAAAFEQLVVRYGDRLHRYLWLELRHESDAHDAFQESLTAAWHGLPALRQADRFWPWLVGIASHKVADAFRRRSRTGDRTPELESSDDHTLLELREAMVALPPMLREILLLRYLLGLSEEEAAVALGVRVGTVKSRSSRARRALLEALT
jgi:RNA polymerase sigma-70 factor (ECF subfamily)